MSQSSFHRPEPRDTRLQRVAWLLDQVRLDEVTEDELDDLNKLLLHDVHLQEFVASEMRDEALVRHELRLEAAALQFREGLMVPANPPPSVVSDVEVTNAYGPAAEQRTLRSRLPSGPGGRWFSTAVAVAPSLLLLALGYLAAVMVARYAGDQWRDVTINPDLETATEPPQLAFVGYVSQENGGIWSVPNSERVGSGFGLRAGDTIRLANGIGQIEISGGLSLAVEGPAELSVQSDGAISMNYGRATARVAFDAERIGLSTPLGDLLLAADTSIGVSTYGSELQVHVFSGSVDIELPDAEATERAIRVEAGEARLIDVSHNYRFRVVGQTLSQHMFASRLSMDTDQLQVGESYIDRVLRSEPVAYWRFEQIKGGGISNTVSKRYDLRTSGNPVLAKQDGNNAIEFGFGSMAGALVSFESIQELSGSDYSVELWMKPAHFHNGAVVNLVSSVPASTSVQHSLLLECLGPFRYNEKRANTIRFLHRAPAGVGGGCECFSSVNYRPRRWQHIVATREAARQSLFVNGQLTAVGEDDTPIQGECRLLVGQLYPSERMRPFVGQLDELAVYDRALSIEEIQEHFDSVPK